MRVNVFNGTAVTGLFVLAACGGGGGDAPLVKPDRNAVGFGAYAPAGPVSDGFTVVIAEAGTGSQVAYVNDSEGETLARLDSSRSSSTQIVYYENAQNFIVFNTPEGGALNASDYDSLFYYQVVHDGNGSLGVLGSPAAFSEINGLTGTGTYNGVTDVRFAPIGENFELTGTATIVADFSNDHVTVTLGSFSGSEVNSIVFQDLAISNNTFQKDGGSTYTVSAAGTGPWNDTTWQSAGAFYGSGHPDSGSVSSPTDNAEVGGVFQIFDNEEGVIVGRYAAD